MRALAVCLFVAGCGMSQPEQPMRAGYSITPLTTTSTSSMRGVSVVNARIAWASGSGGSVLRTTDSGASWQSVPVPDADSLDFRDVEAFDSMTAYVLSAGEDGRIYKTTNGGRTWRLLFRNTVKGAFFDCFDFWNRKTGLVMSDPVNGKFLLLRTEDGERWTPIASAALPPITEGEAAFAASGTCLVTAGSRRALLATGGGAQARVFLSTDRGSSWRAAVTPVSAGAGSAGIFSLAFRDDMDGVALGGDYTKPDAESDVALTVDGGKTWAPAGRTSYVSGAAFVAKSSTIIAVGTKGTRVSDNRGVTWMTIDTLEYNAVQIAADGTGYAVGPRGRIARLSRR